jgi:hypothetical protein
MKISSLLLSVLVCSGLNTAYAESLLITGFNVEEIETLDSQGKVIDSIPTSRLPAVDIPVLEHNTALDLVKIEDTTGNFIWLDVYFVVLNKTKVVDLPCHKLAETSEGDRHETGTMGFGGRCEKNK